MKTVDMDVGQIIQNAVKRELGETTFTDLVIDSIQHDYELRIFRQGDFTVVVLKSAFADRMFTGVSKRSKTDAFNPMRGRAVAISRATKSAARALYLAMTETEAANPDELIDINMSGDGQA